MPAPSPITKSAEDFLHEQIGRMWLRVLRLEYDLATLQGPPPAGAPAAPPTQE